MKRKKGTKKYRALFITIFLIFILAAIAGSTYYYHYKLPNTTDGDKVLLISSCDSYYDMIENLEKSEAFKSWKSFERTAGIEKLSQDYKPGRYIIKEGSSNIEVIRMIRNGWQTPGKLTLSGRIRSNERLASVLSRQVDADSLSFLSLLTDSLFIDSLGFTKETFPAMFIPNTYEVYWTTSAKDILLRFRKEYDHFWNDERISKAKGIGMSPIEVSTMASIVYEESNWVPEQPTIAGVYVNRIKQGIKLQADPTVIFANNDPTIRRVLTKHTKIDSPYNTYKYKGLPPGPIVIPSISAIDAVLEYENHDYIYFCARPEMDGRHNFAVTYSQHLKNASLYRKELNKRGIK